MWKVRLFYYCNSVNIVRLYISTADRDVVVTDKDIGRDPPPILLKRVDCMGTEDDISKCPQDNSNSVFCRNPGAGVICSYIGNLLIITNY